MDGIVTISRWRVPEVRLWAIGGAMGLFTGVPATIVLFWIVLWFDLVNANAGWAGPTPGEVWLGLLGPASLLAFLGLTWAVRTSPSAVVMRVWAALAWAALAGPIFLVMLVVGGTIGTALPRAIPNLILQVAGVGAFVLVLTASSGLAAVTYKIARRWFGPRIAAQDASRDVQ
jgi:hypothetical protein